MNNEELTDTAEEVTNAPESEPELETLEQEEEEEVTHADETSVSVEELVTQITSSAITGTGSESETTTTIDVDTALLYEINTNLTATNGLLIAFAIVAFLIILYRLLRFVIWYERGCKKCLRR